MVKMEQTPDGKFYGGGGIDRRLSFVSKDYRNSSPDMRRSGRRNDRYYGSSGESMSKGKSMKQPSTEEKKEKRGTVRIFFLY